jgi:prophage DNA circulation protein
MTRIELNEAVAVTALVLTALGATIVGMPGVPGAQLNYLCGALAANGKTELAGGGYQFWIDLQQCFEAAPPAGATFETMEAVRLVADGLTPTGKPAIAVKNFSIRLSLAEQARILAATTFKSRQDIDGYFNTINVSFDEAELVAADNMDNVAYRALLAIHATVSNDLANRARPLARMTAYTFPTRMPSLWLAQRLYYDASRNDELIAENNPIHPLFMPSTGAALAQ